jgi:hypothetical protein
MAPPTTPDRSNSTRVQSHYASDHHRCSKCTPSIIYSRGSSGVDYNQLWQCCQCGFALNSYRIDGGCSHCATGLIGSLPIIANPLEAALTDPFDISLGFPTSHSDYEDAYANVLFPEDMGHIQQVVATDDLASTVNANLLRFVEFEKRFEHAATLQQCNGYESSMPPHVDEECDSGDNTFTSDLWLDRYIEPDPRSLTLSTDIAAPNLVHAGHPPIGMDAPMAIMQSDRYQAELVDSAYHTMFEGSDGSSAYHNLMKRKSNDTECSSLSSLMSGEADAYVGTQSKRRRQEESEELRLACPFFKRNPAWCTNKACTWPGYVSVARFKDHLRQAHLKFRCERCQVTFDGKAGAKELEAHWQKAAGCVARPKEDFWGIDQQTLTGMRRCRGNTKEERWSNLYCELFQVDEADDVPSPRK